VIHGDLKGVCYESKSHPAAALTLNQLNILVDSSGRARIVDFSHATVPQNEDSMRSTSRQLGYTTQWAAPEVLKGEAHSMRADIFSFAMVMIEVRYVR